MSFDRRTRMPGLYALLVGDEAARNEREKALSELQKAMKLRDMRRFNKACEQAKRATNEALKAGA